MHYRQEIDRLREEQMLEQTRCEIEDREMRLKQYASQNHHLISTIVQPGVYNSPYLV